MLFRPDGKPGELHKFTEPPTLQFMRDAIGGDLELVPGFDTIGGRRCAAFCNEHGKLDHLQLPFNLRATLLWEGALRVNHQAVLRDPTGDWVDWLVGPVLVLYGDDEFMAEL
jgi:hypothetical protein